jgi:lipopolysaccharide export system permease protein
MFRILDRYIFREVALTWLAVTVVLQFILLTQQFAKLLGEVAKDTLPKEAFLQVIGLTGIQYLTVLIPIGLFLSIMLALGRLYRDSEMPAMMACRVGPMGIYRPLSLLVMPLVFCVGWLSMSTGPNALFEIERIGMEARRQADLAAIEPGRFAFGGSDDAVVYAEKVVRPGLVENVFVQRRSDDGRVEVVVAHQGEQRDTDDPNTRYFVLHNGRRYEGTPGTTEFRVMEFAEHGIPYRLPGESDPDLKPRAMQTLDLMISDVPEEIAELHFRLGIPFATLILAIFAVPLSRSQPRAGRYGRLAIGLLVFIIYFNLMSAGKAWLENGTVAPNLGIWWVHGLMISMALLLLGAQNGVHRRLLPTRTA